MAEVRFVQLSKTEQDEIRGAQLLMAAVVKKHAGAKAGSGHHPRDEPDGGPHTVEVIRDENNKVIGVYIDPPGICYVPG
jgi:hypothetical protein